LENSSPPLGGEIGNVIWGKDMKQGKKGKVREKKDERGKKIEERRKEKN
jgi:hypothetical protein